MSPTRAVGAGLLGAAIIVLGGDVFFYLWRHAPGQTPDIIARGPFLFAVLLPYALLPVLALVGGLCAFLSYRRHKEYLKAFILGATAVLITVTLAYGDPLGLFFLGRNLILGPGHMATAVMFDIALGAFGGWLLVNGALRPQRAT